MASNHHAIDTSENFRIISHTIPAAYIREHPYAIIDETQDLYLAVKQYIPFKTNASHETATSNAATDPATALAEITIIAAGGLGTIKECYEPFFAATVAALHKHNIKVRSIWIADPIGIGASATLNRINMGCDPHWWDHSRDLSMMIQHFRHQMSRPLFALGHSMGANSLAYLGVMHPRLFTSMVLMEPIIDYNTGTDASGKSIIYGWVLKTAMKPTGWPSQLEAEKAVTTGPKKEGWTSTVISLLRHHSIYHDPSAPPDRQWKPTTPPAQEAGMVSRPHAPPPNPSHTQAQVQNFLRPEPKGMWDLIPSLRPRVCYINGTSSPYFGDPSRNAERARITGTGLGGSGGMEMGAVEQINISGAGHMMVLDGKLPVVAEHVAEYLERETRLWERTEKKDRDDWMGMDREVQQSLPNSFIERFGKSVRRTGPNL